MGTEDHNLRCNRKQLEKMILNKEKFGFVQILAGWYTISWKPYSNKTASEEYVWQPSLSLDLLRNSFFLEGLFSHLKSVIVK